MGYARDLTIDGLMEDKPKLVWSTIFALWGKRCWMMRSWA